MGNVQLLRMISSLRCWSFRPDSIQLRGGVQVLAETVEDLVDASPAASMVDGSVILGSKDTTLLVLDAQTGELIEEMAALGGRIMQIADLVGDLPPGIS